MGNESAGRPPQELFQVVVPGQNYLAEENEQEISNIFMLSSGDSKESGAMAEVSKVLEKIRGLFESDNEDVNVLIIEDDCDTAEMFERLFGDTFNLGLVKSEEGLEEIQPETDVVVVERFLDGDDSEEVIDDIKEEWPEKPVILLSSVKPEIEGIDWNADDYAVKPIDREEFINNIEETVAHGGD